MDLPQEAENIFAELQDYVKDYGDIDDCYSATHKLDVNRDLQDEMSQIEVERSLLRISEEQRIMNFERSKAGRPEGLKVFQHPIQQDRLKRLLGAFLFHLELARGRKRPSPYSFGKTKRIIYCSKRKGIIAFQNAQPPRFSVINRARDSRRRSGRML